MNFKNQFLSSFFLLFYTVNAFNITQLLSQYPDFSTFNDYLTQTQLAGAINSRQTITVLAVDNGNMSPVSGKPPDVLKSIMSLHVILDYYDVPKIQHLPKKTAILTTLLQTNGKANGQLGFLNVTNLSPGNIAFGSAVKGSPLRADLVKPIAVQPYNISVLQVSTVIIPLGIDNTTSNSTSSPPPPPSPAPGPSPPGKSPAASPPEPVPAPDASSPEADAPAADAPPGHKHHGTGTILQLGKEFQVMGIGPLQQVRPIAHAIWDPQLSWMKSIFKFQRKLTFGSLNQPVKNYPVLDEI
ncbi:hypothetical protein ACH5RR_024729 [Cinchona calisaya]|uniref:FAS1 domain-containing protein n=1 Tax=Cinchona calisaya TaxID=153742 RepID=A0ABD2Z1Q6_9GENT